MSNDPREMSNIPDVIANYVKANPHDKYVDLEDPEHVDFQLFKDFVGGIDTYIEYDLSKVHEQFNIYDFVNNGGDIIEVMQKLGSAYGRIITFDFDDSLFTESIYFGN